MIQARNLSEISGLIQRMGKETQILIDEIIELSYFSRGAWSYDSVKMMCKAERERVAEFINGRLKAAKKMMFPIF